ncbi:TlpA disulfide reductase family protein [Pedobacter nyackensis]|uniref:Peroxiredoxin n=1 Tax=Pedobacter nyackensis TaxID=475255 RepID=A0A1W2APK9_9SPHI|nr:TlpA disulfide reductase family protein [Pedobacter nyackensis]SMC62381.1 Peroxiredoxin [Pedobacter nyackensis]
MKKIVILIVILFSFLLKVKAQYPALLQLNGTLTNIPSAKKIIFYYVNAEGKSVVDSANVENNEYTFVAQILQPHDATLKVIRQYPKGEKPTVNPLYSPENIAKIFINAGTISVNSTDSFSNIAVNGATWQKDFEYIKKAEEKLRATAGEGQKEWYAYKEKGDTAAMSRIIEEGKQDSEAIIKKLYYPYAKTHPESPMSIWALRVICNEGKSIGNKEIMEAFNALMPNIKSLPAAKDLERYIKFTATTEIGSPAPQFSLQDVDGKSVALSSFKGKYVLVDFWASWCTPCRAQNPYIQAALAQYGNKKFTVLSITSPKESSREAWLKAIEDDKMTWINVWDKEGTVSKMYNVVSIPRNFLINDNGIIIGKDLFGGELDEKLKEILDK